MKAGRAVLAAAVVVASASAAGGGQGSTPVGMWRTFSDADGHETGRVEITDRGGLVYGQIVAILDPVKRVAVCQKCEGERHNQKVLGMQIIRGMKPDGARWDGGEILDPENGSTYHCILRLVDGGQKLVVRGYVGLALLGRSQTWMRVP